MEQADNWPAGTTILVILAHPDDPEFFLGGAIARWTAAGHTVKYGLLTKGASTIDPVRRQQLYSEAQNILVNEVANGFLFEIEYPTFYRNNVKNLVTTAIGLNESFDNVWIAK